MQEIATTEAEAQASLRFFSARLAELGTALRAVHDGLPAGEEEKGPGDIDRDPSPATEMRAVILNVLTGNLQPAVRDLLAAADYRPAGQGLLGDLTVWSAETERRLYERVVASEFTPQGARRSRRLLAAAVHARGGGAAGLLRQRALVRHLAQTGGAGERAGGAAGGAAAPRRKPAPARRASLPRDLRARPLDTETRRALGVWRTPRPLLGYVIRSVDILLRTRLGLSGLGDPAVRLLDPATGSMGFLRAAWRAAPGSGLPGRSLGIELREAAHRHALAGMRRFFVAAGLAPDAGAQVLRADALVPPPELSAAPYNVVIGNPPWRGRAGPRGGWIDGLARDYFQVNGESLGERNPKWLHDDYVRFLRLAQWQIEKSGEGIAALVLNHNLLAAPTFRGLRAALGETFQEIYALDLHGNARRRETGPGGERDENIFPGVAQGAAVLLLVRRPGLPARLLRGDLYGRRRDKWAALRTVDVTTTLWNRIEPARPGAPWVRGDRAIEREYERGLSLPEIFPVHGTGIVTGCDAVFTAFEKSTLRDRFPGEEGRIREILVRPFDLRWIVDAGGLARPRRKLMTHLQPGVGLVVPRQCKGEPGALVTRWLVGHKVICPHDVSALFPLHLRRLDGRTPNLESGLLARLGRWYGEQPEPESVLGYVYGVLSGEIYRRRYRDLLRHGFPRIVFPRDPRLFEPVAALGRELIAVHLLLQPPAGEANDPLAPIDPRLAEFRIGGYRVLSQWLKSRRTAAAPAGLAAFGSLVEAVRLTLSLLPRIDEVVWD